jgi:hypothetical protein
VTDKRIAKFKELGYTILERDKQVEDDGIAYIEDDDMQKLFGAW